MLSRFSFPVRNMPRVMQWLTYLNPLHYIMEIVRGIFLKGTAFSILWPQMLALLIYGVAVLRSAPCASASVWISIRNYAKHATGPRPRARLPRQPPSQP